MSLVYEFCINMAFGAKGLGFHFHLCQTASVCVSVALGADLPVCVPVPACVWRECAGVCPGA